ncbi:MAG: cupredoxin family copper-binding protein [Actinomycetota bacterium]
MLLSSCSNGSSGGQATTVEGKTAEVKIKDYTYDARELTINKGTSVTWTNDDSAAHTVTARDKAFDSGNMDGGQDFTFTFENAGTYEYYCRIHTQMGGRVVVK